MKKEKKIDLFISFISVFVILSAWYIISNFTEISSVFLPKPQECWESFVKIASDGYGTNGDTLFIHLMSSFKRLLIAYGLVIITAIPLGLICGFFPRINAIFTPIIEFYRPLPPLAYYTLLVLWMGIGESSKVMLLYLAGFAPVFINCVSGVKHIKKEKIQAAHMLGANTFQTFLTVVFPASLPDIFTGLRIAIGVEYTTLVAAEMVAAKTGIGWMVLDASNWLKSEVVFFGVILMGITGIFLNCIMVVLEKKIVHWSGKE